MDINDLVIDKRSVLIRHQFFRDASSTAIERLAAHARLVAHPAGARIFRKGSPGTGLLAVISGLVKISVPSHDGREIVLNLVSANDIFGEIALLDGRGPHRRCDRGDPLPAPRPRSARLHHRAAEEPAFAIKLLELVSRRLRRTSEQVEDLTFSDLPTRLAKASCGSPTSRAPATAGRRWWRRRRNSAARSASPARAPTSACAIGRRRGTSPSRRAPARSATGRSWSISSRPPRGPATIPSRPPPEPTRVAARLLPGASSSGLLPRPLAGPLARTRPERHHSGTVSAQAGPRARSGAAGRAALEGGSDGALADRCPGRGRADSRHGGRHRPAGRRPSPVPGFARAAGQLVRLQQGAADALRLGFLGRHPDQGHPDGRRFRPRGIRRGAARRGGDQPRPLRRREPRRRRPHPGDRLARRLCGREPREGDARRRRSQPVDCSPRRGSRARTCRNPSSTGPTSRAPTSPAPTCRRPSSPGWCSPRRGSPARPSRFPTSPARSSPAPTWPRPISAAPTCSAPRSTASTLPGGRPQAGADRPRLRRPRHPPAGRAAAAVRMALRGRRRLSGPARRPAGTGPATGR